ncbi:hypothetical protein UFOVP1290_239 [uncultured Caudovirales phage]|uniref:Uncharacterized protein n=1 Tax=uncultured Caudovirales phage TaxID=2100421 RepID=A0A6J5RI72_9CAUD|nr:hypothetical protein UFOVP1290_239 [uncultured Caudovirales phage]
MYKCQVTGQFSRSGEKMNKIVVSTRSRVYKDTFRNEDTREWETVDVGYGWEIVKEITASDSGLKLWNAMSQIERDVFVKSLS